VRLAFPPAAPVGPTRGAAAAVVLTVEEFAAHVAAGLGLDPAGLTAEARLIEDLGCDSLGMLELVLLLDEMGAAFEAEDLAHVRRLADLYPTYVERRTLTHYSDLACEGGPEPWPAEPSRRRDAPALCSRRTRQRPVTADDYGYLRDLALTERGVLRGPRARAVSPERFAAALWRGVLVQHVVLDAASGAPVGLIAAYDADPERGSVHLALTLDRSVRARGWPFEAVALFVDHLFRTWPLRKIYARLHGVAAASLASGLGRLFAEEGRLVEHEYVDGAWVDVHVLALSRARWETAGARLVARVLDRPAFPRGQKATATR
jgi:acyl carrier protein